MGMLERDASLAPYLRQAAIFIWSLDGKAVLFADARGEDLRQGLGEAFGERARERMRLMGQGLAPLSGVRLERLALSPNPSHPPLTCACRRVRLSTGQEGLLVLAQTAGIAMSAPAPRPVQESKPLADPTAAVPAVAVSAARGPATPEPVALEPVMDAHAVSPVAVDAAKLLPETVAGNASIPPVSPVTPAPALAQPRLDNAAHEPVVLPRRMRFVWSSDAEGQITSLSPEFLALLRLDAPEQIIGQTWRQLIGTRLKDAQGMLAAGLASQATFSEAPVLFRIGQTNGAVNTMLSASPVFAAGHEFQGFRGFGALKPVATPASQPVAARQEQPEVSEKAATDLSRPAPLPAETAQTSVLPEVTPSVAAEAAAETPMAPEIPRSESAPAPVPPMPRGLAALFPHAPPRSRRQGDSPEPPPPSATLPAGAADAAPPAAEPEHAPDPVAVQPAQPAGNDDLPPRLPAVATLQSRLPDMLRQGQPDAPAGIELPVAGSSLRPVLAPAKTDLTPAEKQAFRQIAEALGAEIAESAPPQLAVPSPLADMASPAPEPASQEPVAEEAAETETPEAQAAETEVTSADLPDTAGETVEAGPVDASPVETSQAELVSIAPAPPASPSVPRPSFAGTARALAQEGHAELLDKLPIGVLVSRNGEVAYGNRTFLDLLGYDDLADIVRHGGMESLFRGRAPDEGGGAVLLVAKDGDLETVEARLSAIAWQGRPATLMSFRRAIEADAPARARALELDLDASRKRLGELSSILDTATDGVVTLDERGRILSLNSAAEALFGYDQREVTGEIISMLFAPESHAPAMDYLDGLKGGGVASVLNDGREVVGMVRQGGRVPLFMTMGRIADGADAKFCAVLRDITAWKKAESELTDARKAAEQASAQKSDVLAKISHEIRTPLNAIIGFSEVMAEERFGPIGSERYREYARDIRESGNYLISLVNDLLDLAKIEAGRLDLDFESVNLNDIANAAVSLLQPEAARNRVVLRTGLSTRLPPVVADERSLRQIVINLLSNAVKFTDSGGQVIVSTALGDKGEAILRVRDTGIGMTPDQLKLALEPFRQVSATRRGGGTGLGLPLTKALVEANRGAFQISSVPKEGTLAEVVFPPQRVLAG
jgi:PAS domain S-box-containing protein